MPVAEPGSYQPLRGKTALVTGCSRPGGIGQAVALSLASAGAHVAVTARPGSEMAETTLPALCDQIRSIGVTAFEARGDVGNADDVEQLLSRVVAELGRVDVLVNNAAAPHGDDRGPSWEIPVTAFDEVLRVNTRGVFLMSTAVVRHQLEKRIRGRIINIGSGVARRGMPDRAAYSASKAALVGLTQAMATEVGPHGITVNIVHPGYIETARSRPGGFERLQSASRAAGVGLSVPADRIGQPDDVARVVTFLADPAADYMTGQAINVDGGLMMS